MIVDNRRTHPRFEVRIPGKLMWSNGACGRDCTIKDLSEGGACVATMAFIDIPDVVDLFEGKTGNIFECAVRWQRNGLIGLQFIDMCSRAKRRALIQQHALCVQESATKVV